MKLLSVLTLATITFLFAASGARATVTSQIQSIASQAYVYGFPLVDVYRIMYGYFIDQKSPAFKAPFNRLYNTAGVYTPADRTVQTPNSDTPYSFVGLDLRAQPMVLTLPEISKNRYYSVQFVDEYTFNIGYVGSRTTGNGGGTFLIAGPSWHGATPSSINKVIRFDTDFGLALIRTQLFGPSDLDNVKKIQAGYAAVPLSAFLHQPAPRQAASVHWIAPLTPQLERTSPAFFNVLAFVLQFCPTDPSEVALRHSFATIGIVPGKPFSPGSNESAYVAGMKAGQAQIDEASSKLTSANDLFGTRKMMDNSYINRAVGAQYGILGNTAAEAVYMGYKMSADGRPLDGTKKYILRFAKGGLPPVKAFWSLTMYDLPQQLLVANPINRYLINSPMLPELKLDADGGLTLYIQHDPVGKEKESNWLPAPSGPFFMVLRCYWPQEPILSGAWKQPQVVVAN